MQAGVVGREDVPPTAPTAARGLPVLGGGAGVHRPRKVRFVDRIGEKFRFFVFEIFEDPNRLHRALRSSGPRERSFLADSDALVVRTGVHKGATPP